MLQALFQLICIHGFNLWLDESLSEINGDPRLNLRKGRSVFNKHLLDKNEGKPCRICHASRLFKTTWLRRSESSDFPLATESHQRQNSLATPVNFIRIPVELLSYCFAGSFAASPAGTFEVLQHRFWPRQCRLTNRTALTNFKSRLGIPAAAAPQTEPARRSSISSTNAIPR